jgi:hypothetical protein
VIAALLGTGEFEIFAEEIKKRRARVDIQSSLFSVHNE